MKVPAERALKDTVRPSGTATRVREIDSNVADPFGLRHADIGVGPGLSFFVILPSTAALTSTKGR